MQKMITAEKFEIHYYLKDGSHSMDAVVKNKCEAELLAVAYEIIDLLDLDVTINAEALREGGVKELWNLFVKETSVGEKIVIVLMLLQTAIALIPKNDPELVKLQKEEIALSIEEKKLNIQKLEDELANGEVSEATKAIINGNPKIVTRRSNFYRKLNFGEEVKEVGFSTLDKNQEPLGNEIIIPKRDFPHFILRTNKLPIDTDENAQIEIVAPVLQKGNAKWRGIYKGETINFSMNDPDFKEAVLAKQISFKNGDVIVCVLDIHRELNEIGEVKPKDYIVRIVLDKHENGVLTETSEGKKYRREKKVRDSQGELFN